MKTNNSYFSRILVILIAVMMVFTMMPSMAFADVEEPENTNQSISIMFSAVIPVSDDNTLDPNNTGWNYAVQPQEISVYAGEAYAYGIGTEASKSPTVLDAVVAAHKLKYGEAFTKDTAKSFLNSGLGDYLGNAAAFNVSNTYFGHVINGMYSSDYASTAIIQNGDKIELFPYKAQYPASDYYASFGCDEIIVDAATTLNLKGGSYFSLTSPEIMSNMGSVTVGYIGSKGEIIPLSVTDENGTLTINDQASGTIVPDITQYTLVAYGEYGDAGDLLMPVALKVTVKESINDDDKLQNIKAKVNWNLIQNQNTQNAYVSSKLNLPTSIKEGKDEYAITWKSSSASLVKVKDGTVTGNSIEDKEAILTATIAYNNKTIVKNLYLIIKQKTPEIKALSDAEQETKIQNIIANLSKRTIVEELDAKLLADRDFLISYLRNGGELTTAQKKTVLRQVLLDAQGEVTATNIGAIGKDVLLLTAMGIDARHVKAGNKTINLIDKIALADVSLLKDGAIAYKIPYILFAYDCHENYTLPKNATLTRSVLLKTLLDVQEKAGDGSFTTYPGKMAGDVASVAQAYSKYLDYTDDVIGEGEIRASLNRAKAFISGMKTDKSYFGSSNQNAYIILFKSILNENAREIDKGLYNGNDVVDALLSENQDEKGFLYSGKYNLMATADAFKALDAFSKFLKDGTGDIYNFSGLNLTTDTIWPNATYPVGLYITPPTKTTYLKGESLDTTGMKVVVKYSDGKTKELANDTYTCGKLYSASVGAKAITVTYEETQDGVNTKLTEKFVVNVVESGTSTAQNIVTTTVTNAQNKVIASGTTIISPKSTTVMDVLKQILAQAGKTATIDNGYVRSIDGVGEFDYGGNSGWMVRVDGVLIDVSAADYKLNGGEKIEWFYTKDWTTVPGAIGGKTEEIKNVTSDTKAGTTTAPTEVKVTEKTNADGTKTKVADVKVSADNQKEILKQAKEKKSNEIILVVSKDAVKDAAKADVTLDKSFIDSIVKDTNAKLTIKTPFGDKTYTQEELKAMSAAATGSTISIAVEKAAEEPADDAAAKVEKAKSIVKDMKLTARSSKTAKKNVKAVLKNDAKTKAAIKELKELGFTVKYKFYRSTKKSASYKSAITKKVASYTNTSGKKGTKYFYKVQVRVYDENGKLVAKTALKQCKYASRTWTK